MTKLFKSWRENKKDFRMKFALSVLAIIFILNAGEIKNDVTQAVTDSSICSQYVRPLFDDNIKCVNNGCVWDEFPDGLTLSCKSCIQTGERIAKSDVYDIFPSKWTPEVCCSGNWLLIDDAKENVFGKQFGAICKSQDDPDASSSKQCTKWQKPLAKFVSFDFARTWDCSTKAYAVIFFAIMIFMAVI